MLRAKNYFLLHLGRKANEVIAISAYPNDKIAVFLGTPACSLKRITVNNVDLHLKSTAPYIRSDERLKYLGGVRSERTSREFHIDSHSSDESAVIPFG